MDFSGKSVGLRVITRASESDADSIINAVLAAVEESPLPFLTHSHAAITHVAEKYAEVMKKIPEEFTDLRKGADAVISEAFGKFLKPSLYDQDGSAFFLCKAGGVLKGLIGFSAGSDTTKQKHVGRVVWYWVRRDCRGAGIGSELLDALSDYVSTLKHIDKISTEILTADHSFASEIFKRRGFYVAGIQSGMLKCADGYSDLIMMEKFLVPDNSVAVGA